MSDDFNLKKKKDANQNTNDTRRTFIIIGVILILFFAIMALLSKIFYTPKVLYLDAEYTGDKEVGTVIDKNNKNLIVIATYDNDEKKKIIDYKITPVKLEIDKTYKIQISYEDCECILPIKNIKEIERIKARYPDYDHEYSYDGIKLDNSNEHIKTTVYYTDGTKRLLSNNEWNIAEPVTLQTDKESEVEVKYKNYTSILKVLCTTVSRAKFKDVCDITSDMDDYYSIMYPKLDYFFTKIKGQIIKVFGNGDFLLEMDYRSDQIVYIYAPDYSNKNYEYSERDMIYTPKEGDGATIYGDRLQSESNQVIDTDDEDMVIVPILRARYISKYT